ncbi:MAG: lysylphosphatidylglycerol synthase transmembrane domain-containing protein [Bacillota bacterium]|jgi:uncharacterized protein (TIRG00374 family)
MSGINPRLKRGLWLSAGLSLVTLGFIIQRNHTQIWTVFSEASPLYLGMALLVAFVSWAIRALRLKLITNALDFQVSTYNLLRVFLASCFAGGVTPFNSGTFPMMIYLLNRQGLPLGTATATTAVDAACTSLIYLFLPPVLFYLTGLSGSWGTLAAVIPTLAILLFIGALIVLTIQKKDPDLVSWIKRHPRLARLLTKSDREGKVAALSDELRHLKQGIRAIVRSGFWSLIGLLLSTIAYWVSFLAITPLLLKALRQMFDCGSIILRQMVVQFLLPMIPTLGGSGGAEGLSYWLFRGQIAGAALSAFVLLWRAFTFYSVMIMGGIMLTSLLTGKNKSCTCQGQ